MKRIWSLFFVLLFIAAFISIPAGNSFAVNKEYKAGDVITFEGTIQPGQDIFVTVAMQEMFAPKQSSGPHEVKTFKKDTKKVGFTNDTQVPPLFYILTNNPEKFGKVVDKKFGGPSFLGGIYKTTMFKLSKFDKLDDQAKAMLGPVKSQEQWNFMKYCHEKGFGINTVTKEGSKKGKITIFARSVLTDHGTSGKYWDKGTSIKLDKKTGKYTASFKSYRHTPPDTKFDYFVNGKKEGSFTLAKNGFWLSRGLPLYEPDLDHNRSDPRRRLFYSYRRSRRDAHGRLPGHDRTDRRSGRYQRGQRTSILEYCTYPFCTPGLLLPLCGS